MCPLLFFFIFSISFWRRGVGAMVEDFIFSQPVSWMFLATNEENDDVWSFILLFMAYGIDQILEWGCPRNVNWVGGEVSNKYAVKLMNMDFAVGFQTALIVWIRCNEYTCYSVWSASQLDRQVTGIFIANQLFHSRSLKPVMGMDWCHFP